MRGKGLGRMLKTYGKLGLCSMMVVLQRRCSQLLKCVTAARKRVTPALWRVTAAWFVSQPPGVNRIFRIFSPARRSPRFGAVSPPLGGLRYWLSRRCCSLRRIHTTQAVGRNVQPQAMVRHQRESLRGRVLHRPCQKSTKFTRTAFPSDGEVGLYAA